MNPDVIPLNETMRYLPILTTFLALAVLGCTAFQMQELNQSPTTKHEPENGSSARSGTILAADLDPKSVVGYLGYPLGTVVRVTGEVVDGNTTTLRRDMGRTLLEVHAVNGVKLDKTVVFDFSESEKRFAKPRPGHSFDYYVHESGGFHGVVEPPKELGIDHPVFANDGFYYRRHITIHKSLKPE